MGEEVVAQNGGYLALCDLGGDGGNLGAALVATRTLAKAKHSKVIPVVQHVPSVWAKAKLGAMSSLESAKLCIADKNMETSGNQLPSYKILNAFLARILDESGVAVEVSHGDIISLVCAREEAYAVIAEVAARRVL
ncbi:hypothetical protein ZWY2020_024575 [Hordeum vulgare]|nr:hypothetical protein ZWY2020_024575 [Hordeum vulgare]